MDRVRYLVGIVTLLLALAGGAYLVNLLGDEDQSLYFRVHVEFRNVEGLLPGADVKYRGVHIGSVRRVDLRDDGKKGIAVLVLNPGKEQLACTNSKFWIVTPRFRGLTTGASGLETLVRDAYVSFLTPDPRGPQLANNSSVIGFDVPFADDSESMLAAPRRGDLLMTLLIPENHGVVVGSEVRYRGIETGEVRRVEMAMDGNHVRLTLRIDRRYRQSVTDKTRFWVARPRLSGKLLQGISLDDLSALLIPFVSFHTEPGQGLPVGDGYLVAAEVERPEITFDKVSTEGQAVTHVAPANTEAKSIQAVRVIYEATEDDWLSPDDEIRREGTGVLFEDREGRILVLTARSLCDATYFERDTFGSAPDIISEGISVVLTDGNALRAMRTWVADEGADMVLLTVELEPNTNEAMTPAKLFAFDTPGAGLSLLSLDKDRRPVNTPIADGGTLPEVIGHRGALVLMSERIVGILGQAGPTEEASKIQPITALPESLRPRQ